MPAEPTLALERVLLKQAPLVIGIDEVGRGAIAGPVCVGAAAIGAAQAAAGFPAGLRDSKLLSARRREAIEPACRDWALEVAVGSAGADEIEERGIAWSLAAAAKRALAALHVAGIDVASSAILLDGSHDWLSPELATTLDVRVRPKADRDCAVVACASVVAKVARDREMIARHDEAPEYGWAANKGYASAAHAEAIRSLGPHRLHRRSWLARILAGPRGASAEPSRTVEGEPRA